MLLRLRPLHIARFFAWFVPAAVSAFGCTLMTKVDEEKIPPPSWAVGSSSSSSSAGGGEGGFAGMGGSAGVGGLGGMGGGGVALCKSDAECAGLSGQCGKPRCFPDGLCGVDNEPLGASCNENGGAACDGKGHCIECTKGVHCASGKCGPERTCLPPTCNDSIKNGDETATDCGGSCAADCLTGSGCLIDADCVSKSCVGKICAPSCMDGVQNGSETDQDCGGPSCGPCALGDSCFESADCSSGLCAAGICAALPICMNGQKDGAETDIDCGGPTCAKCMSGRACVVGSDCISGSCLDNVCKNVSCNDGVLNGTETDVDCGGPGCPLYQCLSGDACKVHSDCWSKKCEGPIGNQVCGDPSCFDGIPNGSETDYDCGGDCQQKCPPDYGCVIGADCIGGICDPVKKTCTPTCADGFQNGTETDPDCGGLCPLRCPVGGHCMIDSDCVAGAVCSFGHCF